MENASGVAQLILQLRGGANIRGPQNYAHSVEHGIRLGDVAAELGPDLAALTALYPDGVARFWGSTPTNQMNNYKARALRDRRVGDDVLFYADTAFFARARILHLLHNPAAAKRIWGTDDDGRTWEHMMALGDVERLERPVPAAPILRRLGLSVPLRSLTLATAADYATIQPLLAAAGVTPREPTFTAPRKMTRKRLFKALKRVVDACHGQDVDPSARRLPLTVLWNIGQIASADGHPAEPQHLRSDLESILQRYDATDSRPGDAELSGKLRDSGLWEIASSSELWEVDRSGLHGRQRSDRRAMDADVPLIGFASAVTALLGDPETQGRAVAVLSPALPVDIDKAAFLADVGLAGYDSASGVLDAEEVAGSEAGDQGPARRKTVQIERIVRSSAVAEEVKRLHGHRCQICDTRLATRFGFYSEAAHIKGLGRPHVGSDQIDNVLCLCPNHHVQFDAFAIFIDSDLVVRWAVSGEKIGKLRLHPKHPIGVDNLQHHRRFCGKAD
ncbi:HNH endonuclease [Micromonospora parathelypteridis]|uniref:Putative restriction endonuclease n=1 Tax=Micromonospora parathelypteridis TaxID=1839617 RepID=A0A840VR00_9ACTN|nr:HNH endonuclease [Micromonospora parathelypteridis]MBB5479502.1 putative restriction endonuclease [Micromonospora parathelypteridis]